MNTKKHIIRIFQFILIVICCILFALLSYSFSMNSKNSIVAFIQITIFLIVFSRLKYHQNLKIWHYISWFALFPCYFIYSIENGYQGNWHSRVSYVHIIGVTNPFLSFANMFDHKWRINFLTQNFIKNHNSQILYPIYSLLFFFFCTFLLFVKKDKIKFSTILFNKTSAYLLLLLFLLSIAYHIFSSETNRHFKYNGNIQLWNYSFYYVISYFTLFFAFVFFRKQIVNANKFIFSILGFIFLAFFPIISVSSTIIETYFIDDGHVRLGREVVFMPLLHSITTTIITTFEDWSIRFSFVNIFSIRIYTVFQVLCSLFFILPLLTPKTKSNG